jgi:hypothetical protein
MPASENPPAKDGPEQLCPALLLHRTDHGQSTVLFVRSQSHLDGPAHFPRAGRHRCASGA